MRCDIFCVNSVLSVLFDNAFDTVGWTTGRTSGLYKILHQQSTTFLLWNTLEDLE